MIERVQGADVAQVCELWNEFAAAAAGTILSGYPSLWCREESRRPNVGDYIRSSDPRIDLPLDGEIMVNYRCTPGTPVDRYWSGYKAYVLIPWEDAILPNTMPVAT
jgi:hypothetical protein